ncbi:MAG: hypothetical protein QOH61_1639 [Chloroflexota bacterium]|jgi:hypothetical protein|nr:hypothetical protein [Chloroflexota bacterium]
MVRFGSTAARTAAHTQRSRSGSDGTLVALCLAALIAVAACGGQSAPTGAPNASPTRGAVDPNVTIWPADVISATIALAALDNEIKKAGTDLNKAVETSDPALMLTAADGLAQLAGPSIANAQKLTTYPETKAAGTAYVPVLADINTSSLALAKALRAGDGGGVTTASQQLGDALGRYATIRTLIVDLANKAIEMQKHYVK